MLRRARARRRSSRKGRSSPDRACRKRGVRRARAGSEASSGRRVVPRLVESGWHRGRLPPVDRGRPRDIATSREHCQPGFQPLKTGGDSHGDRLFEDDVLRVPSIFQRLNVLVRDPVGVSPHLVEIRRELRRSLTVRLRGLAQSFDERVVSSHRAGQQTVSHRMVLARFGSARAVR